MRFLKYTTYDIQNLIIAKINTFNNIGHASEKLGISVSELQLFFRDIHFFNPKMYENASKILDMSIEELTEIKEINSDQIIENIKFRESIRQDDVKSSFIHKEIEKGLSIFEEIINIYKLNGGV